MKRFYYSDSIANFINADSEKILGILAKNNEFPLDVELAMPSDSKMSLSR